MRSGLLVAALFGSACGYSTLYTATFETLLTDEAEEPVRDRAYTLCSELVFEGGKIVQECETGFTDAVGTGSVSFAGSEIEQAIDARATLQVGSTEAEGGVVSFVSEEDDPTVPSVAITVDTRFEIPRSVLPEQVTRFDLTGVVAGDRPSPIVDSTGTITIDVVLADGTGDYQGSSALITDAAGIYDVTVDLVSNFAFPLAKDTITLTVELDGYTGTGYLEILDVEGSDPRVVRGFATF